MKKAKMTSDEYRKGYDEGYRRGFFDALKEFKLKQKKVRL